MDIYCNIIEKDSYYFHYCNRTSSHCQKVWTTDKPRKTKYMIVERKNSLKKNKIVHLKIKNYKFQRMENFKYLGVIINEGNSNQMDLQGRINSANKTYVMLQEFLKNKTISKKLKLRLKNTITDRMLTYA